jgi:flavodoxin I
MAKIGIFYGSTNGHTEQVAKNILHAFGSQNADLINIKNAKAEDLQRYPYLILGVSTWGFGDIQKDWANKLSLLDKIDYSNKKVALFSLGDQRTYPDTFVDGMGLLYDKLYEKEARVVGNWYPNGYVFKRSKAMRNGSFVGLVLDEDIQPMSTKSRIEKWTNYLKLEFKLHVN